MSPTLVQRNTRTVVLGVALACTALACESTPDPSKDPTQHPALAGNEQAKPHAGAGHRASVEPGRLSVGPYKTIQLSSGEQAPWFLLPFDKTGACEAPRSRASVVESMKTQNYTDVFLFSHGWNNDWHYANLLYDGWLKGFAELRRDHKLDLGRKFRPLFVGVIWPSTALVLPSEQAPGFRSATPDDDAYVGQERAEIRSLAEALPETQRERFYQLTQRPKGEGLSEADALELARMLAPVFKATDKEAGEDPEPPDPADLVQAWKTIGDSSEEKLGGFRMSLSDLDPRWIVRVATVWQMKDRAGVVGRTGVGPLLDEILRSSPANGPTPRVHLLGHSYGAKVLLSALCTGAKPRKVNSALLLEPAVSYLCFSSKIAGVGKPGGYASAPSRCEQPILSTFTACDQPLTKFFHLALRRSTDLGERDANIPPSIYAALGGFGPAKDGQISSIVKMLDFPEKYPLDGAARIIGINCTPPNGDCDNTAGLDSHGDVSNVHTYWMLYNQIIQPLPGEPGH